MNILNQKIKYLISFLLFFTVTSCLSKHYKFVGSANFIEYKSIGEQFNFNDYIKKDVDFETYKISVKIEHSDSILAFYQIKVFDNDSVKVRKDIEKIRSSLFFRFDSLRSIINIRNVASVREKEQALDSLSKLRSELARKAHECFNNNGPYSKECDSLTINVQNINKACDSIHRIIDERKILNAVNMNKLLIKVDGPIIIVPNDKGTKYVPVILPN